MRYLGIHVWSGDDVTNRETTGEVPEHNWIRRITGEKRTDKRRLVELTVEVRVKESLQVTLVRTSHVESTGDNKLAKRSAAQKMEGKMMPGRPKM